MTLLARRKFRGDPGWAAAGGDDAGGVDAAIPSQVEPLVEELEARAARQ
jgi:hypothetical protein